MPEVSYEEVLRLYQIQAEYRMLAADLGRLEARKKSTGEKLQREIEDLRARAKDLERRVEELKVDASR